MEKVAKFRTLLKKYNRISIDSSIFIYKFEQHPKYEPLCSLIFEKVNHKQTKLITSAITASEILIHPFEKNDHETIYLYEKVLLTMPNFILVEIDYTLAKLAALIRSKRKISLPDAYQIAAALKENAQIFITNDKRLEKVTEIKIACLENFI